MTAQFLRNIYHEYCEPSVAYKLEMQLHELNMSILQPLEIIKQEAESETNSAAVTFSADSCSRQKRTRQGSNGELRACQSRHEAAEIHADQLLTKRQGQIQADACGRAGHTETSLKKAENLASVDLFGFKSQDAGVEIRGQSRLSHEV